MDAKVEEARLKAQEAAEKELAPVVLNVPPELELEIDVLSEADKAMICNEMYDNLLLTVLGETAKRVTVGVTKGRKIEVDEMRDMTLNFLTPADLDAIADKSSLDVQFVPIDLTAARALQQIALYIDQSDPQMELKLEIMEFVI